MNVKIFLFLFTYFKFSYLLDPENLTFLILSQVNNHHSNIANQIKDGIINQARNISKHKNPPNIFLTHEKFTKPGAWAITPILSDILKQIIFSETKWLILCEDQSGINLKALISNLEQEDETKEFYFGYPLYDKDATIIHHFAFFENPSSFVYPLFKAGLIFTIPLLKKLVERIKSEKITSDFFIDASHELALFIWDNGKGVKMTSKKFLCTEWSKECAVYGIDSNFNCNKTVELNKIMFAVKTCKKFHNERLPVILNTWSKYVQHIRFFSDVEDKNIPTISTNIPNTDTGHCEKSLSIFKLLLDEISANKSLKNLEWIVLADDDTILSVSTLTTFLGCFNGNEDICIGERYGYHLLSDNGYNYITGGGGMALTISVVKKIVENCGCPQISSPDDMIIGACLKRLHIENVHSPLFHQARSIDYNEKTLTKYPISFHKFWQIDPIDVYQNWFEQNDQNMLNSIFKKKLCQRKQCDVTNSKNDDLFKHTNKHIDL